MGCGWEYCMQHTMLCTGVWWLLYHLEQLNCYDSSTYKEERYVQWYKVEITDHFLTDIIDINYCKLATCGGALAVRQERLPPSMVS